MRTVQGKVSPSPGPDHLTGSRALDSECTTHPWRREHGTQLFRATARARYVFSSASQHEEASKLTADVSDAKFYFLRGVLHNHPDDRVRLVLQHILDAMGPSSTLLLDELVLPETGVSDYGAALDLTMMTAYAASERTESQWCDLFDSVGLTLARKFVYRPLTYETVMEVRRKVADNGV